MKTANKLDQNAAGRRGVIGGSIHFKGVSFGYSADETILSEVSFSVEPGQTVAIVGQTGAGKSTLSKLVNRIYDVDAGQILVDGVDVREWNLQALRSQISIIEQDVFLFSRSVAENIAFGKDEVDLGGIIESAKAAQAHEFISAFPAGYGHYHRPARHDPERRPATAAGAGPRVPDGPANPHPPDDSTSAIDSATEDKIQRAIWSAASGRTTLLITHRLSQIRWADHIVVLRKGRVVAQGSHEELLRSSESYRHIFDRYSSPDAPMQPAAGG